MLEWLASMDDEELGPLLEPGWVSESTYSWRPGDGEARWLGANLERNYPDEDGVFIGTADYVRTGVGLVEVVDLKTGNAEVQSPGRNHQLRFLAHAAARTGGVDRARVGILHATGERTWWEWAELDAFELEEVAMELRKLVSSIGQARSDIQAGRMPRLTVGEHCSWCQARHGCPARVAMAKRLAGESEAIVRDLRALLSPETAAMAWRRWKAASDALKEVGSALYAYARETPIHVAPGRVWGPRKLERQTIDAALAWPVLMELWGADGARAAMKLTTSKAGLSRALEAVSAPGTKAGRLREVMKLLDSVGAVGSTTHVEYEEYDIAPDANGGLA